MIDRRAVAHASERKRFTAKGERTRTAILDAAERQFAERGYDGVSLRQIMEEASVQMGQLQYYFPSKEAVFVETIERRLPEVLRDYSEAMANLVRRANLNGLDLRQVVRAVMATSRAWLSSNDIGRHRYLKMLGLSTISFSQADFVSRHTAVFKPLNDIAVGYIAQLYAEASADRVLAAYYLLESGLLSLYVNIDSIFARTGRKRTGAAVGVLYDDLENFAVGGMERLLTAP